MKETIKSAIIGALALVCLMIWLATRPSPPREWSPKDAGAVLFPGFRDPAQIRSLSIACRDQESGDLNRLELVRDTELWRIKTKSDAPAENVERIASAASAWIGLTVLSTATELDGADEKQTETFHRQCRLLDPSEAIRGDAADTGVLLEIGGADNASFVRAIIGAVPDQSALDGDLRYVRIAGDDRVYTVDFSAAAPASATEPRPHYVELLSMNPLDWMNTDLLRISRWNIAEFSLFDYSCDKDGVLSARKFFTAKQDPELSIDRVWSPVESVRFADSGPVKDDPPEIPDGKRVNESADCAAHLRFTALEKINDSAAELLRKNRPVRELAEEKETFASNGFYIADHDPLDSNAVDPYLCGEGGEVRLLMTDGVCCRVLFGKKTDDSRVVLVRCSFDPTSFSAADETDPVAVAEEKIALAEGTVKAAGNARRFDCWFYTIPEADYQQLMNGEKE